MHIANGKPFVPFVASCGEWHNFETIAKKGESPNAGTSFFEL
jgi:hypothetical protein